MAGSEHSPIRSREQLIEALTIAAELEHNLCCMYLFAAFSIKTKLEHFLPDGVSGDADSAAWAVAEVRREQARNWKSTILLVARQEMEHLGYVCNLLSAVGGAQHFSRPNFPQRRSYYAGFEHRAHGINMTLEPFGIPTMNRLVQIEMPANLDPNDPNRYTAHDPAVYTEPHQLVAQPFEFDVDLVQTLYTAIKEGVSWLDEHGQTALFIGPPDAQVDGKMIQVGFGNQEFGITLDKISDAASACRAVDLIIEQGEGVVLDGEAGAVLEDSHYERFRAVRAELHDIDWAPAHDVVPNPALRLHPETEVNRNRVHVVTDPQTREVMELFDAGYQIMVFMLIRFFSGADLSDRERDTLLRTAFFPCMTLVIRPLGEMLCEMPAFADDADGLRAGPGFGYSADLAFLPDKPAAWRYLAERLDELAAQAVELRDLVPGLDYISDSVERMATNFRVGMFATGEQ